MNDARWPALLGAYGFAGARLADSSDGRVLRLVHGEREYAVKLFARADEPKAQLESQLLAHLQSPDARYRVQRLVCTRDGAPLCALDESTALVTAWEPGWFKSYEHIEPAEWRALGRQLAALHDRLDSFSGGALEPLSAIMATRDLPRERAVVVAVRARALAHDGARAAAVARYLDDRLRLFDERAERAGAMPPDAERAIHNDYNQFNYLFDGHDPPRILDWEGAIGAPREYEVVRCMNHLPLEAPAMARAFVDGYTAERPLRRELVRWAIDAALTDHALKHWILERWLSGAPDSTARLDGVMRVVSALARDAAQLEAFFLAAARP